MTVKLAIIGAGRIGKVHADAIARTPGAQLASVADIAPDAAADLARTHGAEVANLEQILESGDVDAVLITSPTDLHAEQIERAARAGKAIFCEKPIDLEVARVRRCLEVVHRERAQLMVGFNRRFDPNFASLRGRILNGDVGEVEIIQITSRDPGPPPVAYIPRSGGLFRDMMIHDLDMARFLLDEEPVEVMAMASNLVDPEIGSLGDVDSATVMLRTASGKLCQISNSRRASYGYDQRVEVHGSSGMVRAENMRATTVEVAGKEGYRRDPLLGFFMDRYAAAYAAEIAAFIGALEAGHVPTPSGEDGLRALLLAEAAARSVETGRVCQAAQL